MQRMIRLSFFLPILMLGLGASAQKMHDSSDVAMQELVISADRFEEKLKDIPRQIELISSKQIRHWNKQNTADLLEASGKVFVQKSQQGGGSPVIRGFEANRVLLVIDGIRLNNAIYRSGHLQNILRIDQENIEKVEILFGSGSLIYGSDALGGVVHFTSLKPVIGQKWKVYANQRYSSVNKELTQSIGLSGSYKKIALLFNYTESNYGDLRMGAQRPAAMGDLGLRTFYQTRTGDTDRVVKNDDPNVQIGSAYKQLNFHGKLVYQPKVYEQHTFSFFQSKTGNVPRYDRLSEMKGNTPVYGDWYYGPEKMLLGSYHYSNGKVRKYTDQISLTLAYQKIAESRNSRNFGSNSLSKREETVDMLNLNLDFRKKKGIHEWRYGAEMVWNQVTSVARKESVHGVYIGPSSTRYPDGGSNMSWAGLYSSFSHELNKKWILHEGVRLNGTLLEARFKDKSFFDFLPNTITQKNLSLCGNIGLVYLPNNNHKLYFNVGNGFRTPNVDDVGKIFDSKSGQAMILPNAQLKAEQSITGEVGMLASINKQLELDWNVYYTVLNNALVIVPYTVNGKDSLLYDGKLTPVFTPDNAQSAFVYGSSLSVKWKVNKYIKMGSSLSYTYGRIVADSMMPLDHIPPMYGRTEIAYQKDRWQVLVYSLYNGKKALADYYLNGEDNLQYATPAGMPAWFTLNLQAGYRLEVFKTHVVCNVGVDNLLDRNYRTFASGMSAGGRNVWVNLRISLN